MCCFSSSIGSEVNPLVRVRVSLAGRLSRVMRGCRGGKRGEHAGVDAGTSCCRCESWKAVLVCAAGDPAVASVCSKCQLPRNRILVAASTIGETGRHDSPRPGDRFSRAISTARRLFPLPLSSNSPPSGDNESRGQSVNDDFPSGELITSESKSRRAELRLLPEVERGTVRSDMVSKNAGQQTQIDRKDKTWLRA